MNKQKVLSLMKHGDGNGYFALVINNCLKDNKSLVVVYKDVDEEDGAKNRLYSKFMKEYNAGNIILNEE